MMKTTRRQESMKRGLPALLLSIAMLLCIAMLLGACGAPAAEAPPAEAPASVPGTDGQASPGSPGSSGSPSGSGSPAEPAPDFPLDDVQQLIYAAASVLGWGYADEFDAARGGDEDRRFADALLYEFVNYHDYMVHDENLQIRFDESSGTRLIRAEAMLYLLRRYIGDYPKLIQPPAGLFIFTNQAGDYYCGYSDKGLMDYEAEVEGVTYVGGDAFDVTAQLYELLSDEDGDSRTLKYRFAMRFIKDEGAAFGYTLAKCGDSSRWETPPWGGATGAAGPSGQGSGATGPGGDPYAGVIGLYRDQLGRGWDDDEIRAFADKMSRVADLDSDQLMYELTDSVFEAQDAVLGYAVKDINGDGSPELFILTEEYGDICAIYTLRGGKPALVGGYWSRHNCSLDADGTIYISGSSSAASSHSGTYALIPGSIELRLIRMVGMEDYDEEARKPLPEPRYYRIENGRKTIVTDSEGEREWQAFYQKESQNTAARAGLAFTLIGSGQGSGSPGALGPSGASVRQPAVPGLTPMGIAVPQPGAYEPVNGLLALVSDNKTWGMCINGPAVFYDEARDRLVRPEGVEYFFRLYDYTKYVTYGYAVYKAGGNGKAAIMSPDGKILSGYIYEGVSDHEGMISWPVRNGYSLYEESGGRRSGVGVVDLRTGKSAIDPVYDEITMYEDFAVAWSGMDRFILAYDGSVLIELKGRGLDSAYDYDAFPSYEQTMFYMDNGSGAVIFVEKAYDWYDEYISDLNWYSYDAAEILMNRKGYDEVSWETAWIMAAVKFVNGGEWYPPGDDISDEIIDMYSPGDGNPELLMSGVLGFVWDWDFNGYAVVYPDERTCVLLYSDGSTQRIPIDFTVSRGARYMP